jgi:hypothetical protein
MSAPTEERIEQAMRSVDPGWDHERAERALEGLHRRARRRRLERKCFFLFITPFPWLIICF